MYINTINTTVVIRISLMDIQADEEWALLADDSEAHQRQSRKGCKSHVLFISLLTDWPWEIAASFARNENVTKTKCLSCIQWVYVILLILMVVAEMVTQDLVTYRRDRFDKNSRAMEFSDHKDHENDWIIIQEYFGSGGKVNPVTYEDSGLKLFIDVFILDLITCVLLIWVIYSKIRLCKRTKTEDLCTETRNLQIINLETENPLEDPLIKLIKAVKGIQRDKLTSILFVIFPIVYIIISFLISAFYLFLYFEHKQVMWPGKWEVTGPLKITVIAILLVTTTAIDLLYLQIIMRYVLRSQLNIYFLQLITGKVECERYRNQDLAIKDVEKAKKFLKQLNASSRITGLVIISALIQAINCAINLSDDMDNSDQKTNSQLEVLALSCRLLLWIFLIMIPFIQAARANGTLKDLSDTGLVMIKPPVLFRENTPSQNRMIKKNLNKITLNVKLFSVTIQPGYIYLAIITILLLFALRSAFQLFEQLL